MKRSIRYRFTVWILEALAAGWISQNTARSIGRRLHLKGF
jgi:hypothetical protein